MKTIVYPMTQYREIAQQLASAEIIALPTDTVFGLAALATSPRAVEKLLDVKQRPQDKAFSYLVANVEMIEEVCELRPRDYWLISRFLPGPWTFIFNKKYPNPLVDNGLKSLAIRICDLKETLAVIEELKTGVYLPSANISGQPPLVRVKDVYDVFSGKIAGILDMDAQNQEASTIVDCTQDQLRLIRAGVGDYQKLKKVMKENKYE